MIAQPQTIAQESIQSESGSGLGIPPVKQSGLLGFLRSLFTTYGGEIEVFIAENRRGGFSIYPANCAAAVLFSAGREPASQPCELEAGNFGTYADAYTRAHRDNCWTVVEPSGRSEHPAIRNSQSAIEA